MPTQFKELSKNTKIFRVTMVIVMLVYSIVTLVLAIKSYTSLEQNVTIVLDTINNWKTGAISDFKVSINGTCDPGYEFAYDFRWAGTKVGCDCRPSSDSDFRKLSYKSGACNNTEFSKGCIGIDAYGYKQLSIWGRNGYQLSTFCIKRSNDTWAKIGPSQGTTCPVGKIKCGTSPDNIFCSSDTKCPITSVSITTTPCANCTQFEPGRYVNVTRGGDDLPLAEFRLNEYGMCYEVNQQARTKGRSYYFLYARDTYDCNKEGNGLWNAIDSRTEASLFSMNSNMPEIVTYLNNYGYYTGSNNGNSYTWYIFNRGYVPWRLGCRDRMDDIINKATDLQNVRTAHLGMLVVTVISTIIVGIVLCLMEVMNLAGCDLPCIDGRDEEERQKLLKIKQIAQFSVKILLLPFQIWAIVILQRTKSIVYDVAGDQCSSSVMNGLISNASDSLQNAYKSDVAAICALIFFTLLSILGCCCRKKIENREKQNKVSVTGLNVTDNTLMTNPNETSFNQSHLPLNQPYQHPYDQQNLIPLQPTFQQPYLQQQPYQQQSIMPQPVMQQPFQQPMRQQLTYQPGIGGYQQGTMGPYQGQGFNGYQPNQGQQITIQLQVPGLNAGVNEAGKAV